MDPMLQFLILLAGEIVFNFIAVYMGYLLGKIPLRPAFATLAAALAEARTIRSEVGTQVPALEKRFADRIDGLHERIPSRADISEDVRSIVNEQMRSIDGRISVLEQRIDAIKIPAYPKIPTSAEIIAEMRPELKSIHSDLMEELRLSERRVRDDMNKQINEIGDRITSKIEKQIIDKVETKLDDKIDEKLKFIDKLLDGKEIHGSFTDKLFEWLNSQNKKK